MDFLFTTLPIEGLPQPSEGNNAQTVYENFRVDPLPGQILYAYYLYEDYSGYAYVLYRDEDGALWEVEGSHCSCNGLEGQWSPGEVTVPYLRNRCEKADEHYGFGRFAGDVLKVVQYLEANNG